MQTIRTRIFYKNNRYCVDLPSYVMVPGSWRPLVPGKVSPDGVAPGVNFDDPELEGLTCEVIVDDIYMTDGAVDVDKLRDIHRGHPRWDDPDRPPRIFPNQVQPDIVRLTWVQRLVQSTQ